MKIDIYLLDRHFKYTRFVSTPMMSVLKAWTVSLGHEARVTACGEDGVDLDTDADAVAFSVYTFMAPAVYRISDILRKKGKAVVLGGPHFHGDVTLAEGMAHGDVIAQSIHRGQWESILRDIGEGKIRPFQDPPVVVRDREHLFRFPDNLHEVSGDVNRGRFSLVMTSLGCPHGCEFCNPFMQGKYFLRGMDDIYRELAAVKSPYAVICDATFGMNRTYTIELMKKIAPLGKLMFAQTTLHYLDDAELLDAFMEGGVRWVSVGIESLSLPQKKHGKNRFSRDLDRLRRILADVAGRGLLIQGNFVCGLDGETAECFDLIRNFYRRSDLNSIIVDVIAPYPTTELYRKWNAQGRIFDFNWEHYDYHHVVYRPTHMTVEQLIDGIVDLNRDVNSVPMLARKNLHVLGKVGPRVGWPTSMWNIFNHLGAKQKKRELLDSKRYINDHVN